jgi:hypothetical protein
MHVPCWSLFKEEIISQASYIFSFLLVRLYLPSEGHDKIQKDCFKAWWYVGHVVWSVPMYSVLFYITNAVYNSLHITYSILYFTLLHVLMFRGMSSGLTHMYLNWFAFFCEFFYNAATFQTTWHQMIGWLMNDELQRMWMEAVMAWLKYYDVTCQDSQCPGWDSNRAPPK